MFKSSIFIVSMCFSGTIFAQEITLDELQKKVNPLKAKETIALFFEHPTIVRQIIEDRIRFARPTYRTYVSAFWGLFFRLHHYHPTEAENFYQQITVNQNNPMLLIQQINAILLTLTEHRPDPNTRATEANDGDQSRLDIHNVNRTQSAREEVEMDRFSGATWFKTPSATH